ncbi:MAG: hypothetical protein HY301_15620 [Verrucomicrobia bacterium]|nr:hypothetical protein [Verrucomicrobiota bacterium]
MATTPKAPSITDWFLTRWLGDCEKSPKSDAPSASAKAAEARALPVRFMFGIDGKNAIVPILHRSTSLRRHADAAPAREAARLEKPPGKPGR